GAVARTVPNGTYHHMHGSMLEGAGRLEEAEAAYRRAVSMPAFTHVERRAHYDLLRVELQRQRQVPWPLVLKLRSEARQNLRWLAAHGTYPPGPCSRLMYDALELGELDLALYFSDLWVRQKPDDLRTWQARANAALEVGAFDLASEAFATALAKKP